jgi:hypothetical protein
MSHPRARRWARFLGIAALALALRTGGAASAQDHAVRSLEVLRADAASEILDVGEPSLVLTKPQAEAFWPIYDDYAAQFQALRERFIGLLDQYAAEYRAGTMSDARAVQLLDQVFAVDEAEAELQKDTAQRLKAAIPGIEAVRYLRIDSETQAVVTLAPAEEITLVD